MRPSVYIFLFALVLATPFLLAQTLKRGQEVHVRGMSPPTRLVIVTPHNQDIRREFARAFAEWYAKEYDGTVVVDYRQPGGTNDIKRLLENNYRGYRRPNGLLPPEAELPPVDIDVVWGGGDNFFNAELKPQGILRPLDLPPELLAAAFPEPVLAGIRLYDYSKDDKGRLIPPQWVGVCLSSFGIVYNPQLYQTLELRQPAHWADLTDERLSGLVALADPTHSGSAAVAYVMVLQRAMADGEAELFARKPELKSLSKAELAKSKEYNDAISRGWKRGMGQLLLIAANARYFTDSGEVVPTDVARGEAAAGMAIDFFGRVTSETVGAQRCQFVAPVAATAITPDPVAILYGVRDDATRGPRLTVATRFIEYLLSPEGQRLWILKPGLHGGPIWRGLRRPPVRRDLYADRTGWADDVNPFADAGGFNQRGEWMALFSDTRMIWAAAWIDSRDDLRAAYRRILAVADAARRATLIAELADLPIEMRTVEELKTERRRRESAAGADEWKARTRIEWAQRFRDHYAAVARKASN